MIMQVGVCLRQVIVDPTVHVALSAWSRHVVAICESACSDMWSCVLCPQRTTDFARRDETRQRLTEQERQERNQQLQKTLTLLVHACSCHDPQCSSTSCRKVRRLFKKSCFAPGVLAAYLTGNCWRKGSEL